MWVASLLCLVLAVFGHGALWVALFNRLHATGMPRRRMEWVERTIFLGLLGLPAAVLASLLWQPAGPLGAGSVSGWVDMAAGLPVANSAEDGARTPGIGIPGYYGEGHPALRLATAMRSPVVRTLVRGYFWLCFGVAGAVIALWVWRVWQPVPACWIDYRREVVPVGRRLGRLPCHGQLAALVARLPGNQVLDLEVNEKTFVLPRLPASLDGLTIAHLSDLHLTGELTEDFYYFAVERINAMEADLVAVTGDLIDARPCLAWIPDMLSRLRSRHGTFCVLGNHDQWFQARDLLRSQLEKAGAVYLGGRWTELAVRGQPIVLAGNELPWFRPAAELSRCPPGAAPGRPLRVLLSHSPDQIHWARRRDVDLMLAGHTHGGQIRFPLVGPLVSPSRHGVRFASGVFFLPPTLLHVSRGLAARELLRFNCRPEVSKLILRSREPLTVPFPQRHAAAAARPAIACQSTCRAAAP